MFVDRFLFALLFACAVEAEAQGVDAQWRDPSPHAAQLIAVEQGVQIELLDWGGSGRAVLLVAGLGNTAHVFDDFAPKLTGRFHVYGVTRRGFGESSKPQNGFDVGRLVDDIAAVIRARGIDKPLLVGHSFAGDELTELGARYPELVGGLIYLDAAADRTAPVPEQYTKLLRTLPPAGNAQEQAYTSYAAMAAYAKQPESEIRQRFREAESGRLVSRVELRIVQAVVAGIKRPAYTSVAAPALAFVAVPASAGQLFSWIESDEPTVKKTMATLYELNIANIKRQSATFDEEVADSQVIELVGANHHIFMSNEADVLTGIVEFAAAHPPARRNEP